MTYLRGLVFVLGPGRPVPRPIRSALVFASLGLALLLAAPARAQEENPVYVDDSPRAWQILQRADDHLADNVGEAVRLYQELLDDYGDRVLPVGLTRTDQFASTRTLVLRRLAGQEEALRRHRLREAARAEELWTSGAYERLALTRPLTSRGLDAMLQLAQTGLERGWFRGALGWLDEAASHPDADDGRRVFIDGMAATAAHHLGETARRDEALARLRAAGRDGAPFVALIDALIDRADPPRRTTGITINDTPPTGDFDALVGEPIWEIELPDGLLRRRLELSGDPSLLGGAATDPLGGDQLTAAPAVAGDTVFVSEGYTVRALDLYTGEERWRYAAGSESDAAIESVVTDLNVVAVAGETVVTITGHALGAKRTRNGAVVCLDRRDGAVRWSTSVRGLGLDDETEDLFPYGAPIVAEGAVYVLARKVTPQMLTSCYVVCLDEQTGETRWARHIASCGGVRTQISRPFSTPVYDHGALYVATAVGAVARIDVHHGLTRWLQRYRPPVQPNIGVARPWEIGAPAVTERGLVAIRPDRSRVALLDLDTGDELETHGAAPGEAWAAPKYLLSDGRMIVAVGREVRAFSIDDLSTARWRLPESNADAARYVRAAGRVVRGRVQLTRDAALVPVVERLLMVDLETGAILNEMRAPAAVNPLLVDGEMLIASEIALRAYMPVWKTVEVLRDRIEAEPDNPDPALSLMRIADHARDLDLALEAADLAYAAIRRMPPGPDADLLQTVLFDRLLELHASGAADGRAAGEELHARLDAVANGPAQRVEQLLAYADWAVDHDLGVAVEAHQTILADPLLSRTPLEIEDVQRSGGDRAAARLSALIRERGVDVYAPQAAFARRRLDALLASPDADAEAFLRLALAFPFADAALDAALESARRALADRDEIGALAAVAGVNRRADVASVHRRLIGPAVVLCLEMGRESRARALLRDSLRRFGDLELSEGFAGAPNVGSTARWLASLQQASPHATWPDVGTPGGGATERSGRLVAMHANADGPPPHDAALLEDDGRLVLVQAAPPDAGSALVDAWSVEFEGEGPDLLAHDEERLVLWHGIDWKDPRAEVRSPADGSVQWTSARLDRFFDRGLEARPTEDRMPNQEPFRVDEIVPTLDRSTLVTVRRNGDAVGFDLTLDEDPLWVESIGLSRVYHVALDAAGLVASGVRTREINGRQTNEAAIVLIDPRTGATLASWAALDGAPAAWMRVTPFGELLYGGEKGVELIDLLSGEVVWSARGDAASTAIDGWAFDDVAFIAEPTMSLRLLSLRDGSVSAPLEAPERDGWRPLDLFHVFAYGDVVIAHFQDRMLSYDRAGRLVGADAIADERSYRWILPAADRLVIVSRANERRNSYVYRLYAAGADGRVLERDVELGEIRTAIRRARLMNGVMLLSTDAATYVIPAPSSG